MTATGIALGTRTLARLPSWTVVDAFAQAWGTRGALPPPIGPVRVLVEARFRSEQWRPIDPPLELEVRRSLSDVFVLTMRATPMPSGPLMRLPEGRYRVRIVSDYYREQVIEAELAAGAHPAPIALEPAPAYPFPPSAFRAAALGPTALRGSLRTADGRGIAGAAVEIADPATWTFDQAVTDGAGEWLLLAIGDGVGIPASAPENPPAAGTVQLRITVPGTAPIVIPVPVVRGRDNVFVQTSLRGAIVDAAGVPVRDAVVGIVGRPERTRSDAGGAWWLYLDPEESHGVVTLAIALPDGRTLQVEQVLFGQATTVVPTIRVP